ncbi:hypothetical protein FLK61_38950 [Paenalkalicoccus suaedae]|uniref:Uncharacterized protein n=1 Tax=Paenalkalicoccus suaedae TaxID=2592382 RepID=A0A859FHI4_9BACI|nr:hypothetical protein [Paenalkalicoccus suaedae]QKS72597.1 hypothetical protein FLK61_38950 [Paenalkalicoccus suaedae]
MKRLMVRVILLTLTFTTVYFYQTTQRMSEQFNEQEQLLSEAHQNIKETVSDHEELVEKLTTGFSTEIEVLNDQLVELHAVEEGLRQEVEVLVQRESDLEERLLESEQEVKTLCVQSAAANTSVAIVDSSDEVEEFIVESAEEFYEEEIEVDTRTMEIQMRLEEIERELASLEIQKAGLLPGSEKHQANLKKSMRLMEGKRGLLVEVGQ